MYFLVLTYLHPIEVLFIFYYWSHRGCIRLMSEHSELYWEFFMPFVIQLTVLCDWQLYRLTVWPTAGLPAGFTDPDKTPVNLRMLSFTQTWPIWIKIDFCNLFVTTVHQVPCICHHVSVANGDQNKQTIHSSVCNWGGEVGGCMFLCVVSKHFITSDHGAIFQQMWACVRRQFHFEKHAFDEPRRLRRWNSLLQNMENDSHTSIYWKW